MREKYIPLGTPSTIQGTCLAVSPAKLSDSERLRVLEDQVSYMSRVIAALKRELKKANNAYEAEAVPEGTLNKHGIPIGTVCTGVTEKSPALFYLTVLEDGYQVGSKIYESLSAAAQHISGVRRSGWTFWKLSTGLTLKEVYKGN